METKFTMGVPTFPLTGFKLATPSVPSASSSGLVSGLDLLSGCALPAFSPSSSPPSSSSSLQPCLPSLSSFFGAVSFPPLHPQPTTTATTLFYHPSSVPQFVVSAPPTSPSSLSALLQKAGQIQILPTPSSSSNHHSEGTSTEDDDESESNSTNSDDDDDDSEDTEAAKTTVERDLLHPDSKDRGSSSTNSPILLPHHHHHHHHSHHHSHHHPTSSSSSSSNNLSESAKLPGRRGRRPKPPHERRHKCSMCNRDFKRMEHLKRHLRVHTGEKPFSCPLPGCPKYFSRQDNLTQHIKTHKNRSDRENSGQLEDDADFQ